MRLLPWAGPDGQACYVATDGNGGYVSLLADEMEEVQLTTGAELLGHVADLLREGGAASAGELRFCVHRLAEALRDALRIAESRGARIIAPGHCHQAGDTCLHIR